MGTVLEPIAQRRPAHEPVLVGPVTALLAVPDGAGVLVDATVGVAGHAAALLAASGPDVRLVGFDRDADALELAGRRLAAYGDRVQLLHAGYEELTKLIAPVVAGAGPLLGVLYDLGVSSLQLDRAARGFSFRASGPLDMRMDPTAGATAADVVNTTEQRELARLLRVYGEERYAPRIAAAIVRSRPLTTTGQLAEVVSAAVPTPARHAGTHPATKTFQALRIVVNAELDRFSASLPQALEAVAPAAAGRRGGRIAVLGYHSGEDRLAKRFFADAAVGCICPPQLPVCGCGREPMVRLLTRGAQRPDDAEIRRNPRARSARLRAAEKVADGPIPTASSREV
ncbi:MAG: 16S rRNA (cytosine(1402)-N(4))-methyltransferase RsmH [Actinomycetota bacterium]|nr:16S rRNA (cytosine(1402)-N(4))-methyltransferase RsmH [Euzebyaceae bacterium]MBA3621665.1 16S rRNA (cytosine(1402)-N(4))-methyltransferase RsmH [Euzebyales bacterium]MDQ3452818.1 16S rRNA (cytosine(1402)-N(4))-methyltransferase RsmH [Actinomycetota bacterium]